MRRSQIIANSIPGETNSKNNANLSQLLASDFSGAAAGCCRLESWRRPTITRDDPRFDGKTGVIAKLVVLKNYVLRTTIYRMRS